MLCYSYVMYIIKEIKLLGALGISTVAIPILCLNEFICLSSHEKYYNCFK